MSVLHTHQDVVTRLPIWTFCYFVQHSWHVSWNNISIIEKEMFNLCIKRNQLKSQTPEEAASNSLQNDTFLYAQPVIHVFLRLALHAIPWIHPSVYNELPRTNIPNFKSYQTRKASNFTQYVWCIVTRTLIANTTMETICAGSFAYSECTEKWHKTTLNKNKNLQNFTAIV